MKVKSYTKKELRQFYGISRETFNKWMRAISHLLPHYRPSSRILTPAQVKVLFEEWGEPDISEKSGKTSVKPA